MSTRGTVAMGAANAVALLTAAGGYLVYSRILSPANFALYAGALAIAKFGTMVLDGGIKVALIQEGSTLSPGAYRSAFLACVLLASGCLSLLGTGLGVVIGLGRATTDTAGFLLLYATAYFASYPFIVIPLADLERNIRFGAVAWAEGTTFCIEYALPAVLWIAIRPGMWSFVASVWLARAVRVTVLMAVTQNRRWLARGQRPAWHDLRRLFGVGIHFQLASAASMFRDNLHLLIIAPLFGKDMAGMYAWAMQICAVTSQVFVQTVSRVAFPVLLAAGSDEDRWKKTMGQIRWLTVLTFPPLLCLQFIAPAANITFFHGKWVPALALLPFIIWRMLPGLATTPVGWLLLAQAGARRFAVENGIWSFAEAIAAGICIAVVGAKGLAVSYSFMAWLGVALFAARLRGSRGIVEIARTLLLRPSEWVAMTLTIPYGMMTATLDTKVPIAVLYAIGVCAVAVGSEFIIPAGLWRRSAYVGKL